MSNPYLPLEAEVVERIEETPTIFTLRLRFTDPQAHEAYSFDPGQFNMLYLHGVGEVPISIVSDPQDEHMYAHTIRAVGRVTRGLAKVKVGDRIGVRGPYGRGWPLAEAEGRDVIVATGGLGCAPVVSVINYVMKRRERFRRMSILQGVKHAADLIWQERYREWAAKPNTQVLLAADQGGQQWPFQQGNITVLFEKAEFDPQNTIAMLCGPEGMMRAVIGLLLSKGMPECAIWLSMERNMQCGLGHCGHCQVGGNFVCKDGPVFCYAEVKELLGVPGF